MRRLLLVLLFLAQCCYGQVTTSPQVGGVITSTGATGTGILVFSTSPTMTTATNTGNFTVTGNFVTGTAAGSDYIVKPGNAANTGKLQIQAGGGSAGYGGSFVLYSHSNASHPGDVVAAISTASGGAFRFNSGGLDTGTDVVTIGGTTGNVATIGSVSAATQYNVNGTLLSSATAPTISSGFGSSPSIASNNGTATFRVNIGTGGTASSGVIGLPTAANGWNCLVSEFSPNSTALLSVTVVTASSNASVTVANDLLSTGAATAWQVSQVLILQCSAY